MCTTGTVWTPLCWLQSPSQAYGQGAAWSRPLQVSVNCHEFKAPASYTKPISYKHCASIPIKVIPTTGMWPDDDVGRCVVCLLCNVHGHCIAMDRIRQLSSQWPHKSPTPGKDLWRTLRRLVPQAHTVALVDTRLRGHARHVLLDDTAQWWALAMPQCVDRAHHWHHTALPLRPTPRLALLVRLWTVATVSMALSCVLLPARAPNGCLGQAGRMQEPAWP